MTSLVCALLILSADATADTSRALRDACVVFRGAFESASDANFDAWPDHWTRRKERGYPAYIGIEIVDDAKAPSSAPNRCLRIKLDGGAAEVFSPSIPVSSRFNYALEGRIRTSGLQYDIVTLKVGFYDKSGTLVETYESEPVCEADEWLTMRLGPVRPESEQLRYAVVSAHVRPTGPADLWGEVFLDDLRLERLPRISLEMNNEFSVYSNPEDVQVACRVSGLMTDQPRVRFELTDVHGQVHDSLETTMEAVPAGRSDNAAVPSGFAGNASWKPRLPGVGFYNIGVSIPGYAGRKRSVAVVAPLGTGDKSEFGWSLPQGEMPFHIKSLPSLLGQIGLGWVKFPVWYSATANERADELAWFAERLSSNHVNLVGVLDQPPADIRSSFGSAAWIPAASLFDDRAVWYPALDPVLTRLSLKVRWWQLGRDDDTSFNSLPDVEAKVRAIRDDLTSFGQQVKVGFPWRTVDEPPQVPRGQPSWSFLSFIENLPLTANETGEYFGRPELSQCDTWIVVHTLSSQEYDLDSRIQDLLQRVLAAKIAKAKGIFIADPFNRDHGLMNQDGSPNELFLPWRTAASLIGGATYLGSMKLPGGSSNQIFVRDAEAVMVVWNDTPTRECLYLGEHVQVVDVWGQTSAARDVVDGEFQEQEIDVGPMPVFITGLDPNIAAWRMQFQFETERLASIFGQSQSVIYRFRNTLSQPVGGRLSVLVPSAWQSENATRHFKLTAGEEHQDELRVMLGTDVSSGPQPLQVLFDLSVGREIRFRLNETIEVGLGDIQIDMSTSLDEQGNLVVRQDLINNTEKSVSFNCLLFVPNRRREKRQVFYLNQGRVTNTFVLANGRELLGKTLWLRAEEINGARILNEKVVAQE
ncbi:MAG: hypothetical protein AB7F89_13065 [Pirellulaceae bacterium]